MVSLTSTAIWTHIPEAGGQGGLSVPPVWRRSAGWQLWCRSEGVLSWDQPVLPEFVRLQKATRGGHRWEGFVGCLRSWPVWLSNEREPALGACYKDRKLSSALCDDLHGWDGGGTAGRSERERIYVYKELVQLTEQWKLTQHCKAIIFQLKREKRSLRQPTGFLRN